MDYLVPELFDESVEPDVESILVFEPAEPEPVVDRDPVPVLEDDPQKFLHSEEDVWLLQ